MKGVYFQYVKDTETLIHYHDYVEHIIMLEGKMIVETSKQSFLLNSGDDLTIPASTPHFLKVDAGTKHLTIWHPILDHNLTDSYPINN